MEAPRSNQDKLEQTVSPLFFEDAGDRLRMMRMKMLMDQAELGELLGMSQQQVSKLESGHMSQPPFTLARLKAVFGKNYTYILFGSNRDAMNPQVIHETYWEMKLKLRRKVGSGLWRKRNTN